MRTIATEAAPKAIGPYSQAIAEGGFLFTSGQIPLDPGTGELVPGGIEASVERVFDNLEAILAASGLTLADVVKTTVYLKDGADSNAMSEEYARHFSEPLPARSSVVVSRLKNAEMLIEIEAVAIAR